MTFVITKYIYPLDKSITLSNCFNYVLDNPRSEEEIALVRKFINATFEEKQTKDDSKKINLRVLI